MGPLDKFHRNVNTGYGEQPLGGVRDDALRQTLEKALARLGFGGLRAETTEDHEQVFRALAERLCSLAVRNNDPTLLRTALVALCLGARRSESREAILILPLAHRAAELLGVNPDETFAAVARTVDKPCADFLLRFLMREDKSISQMGYAEVHDPDGFRFIRTW